MVASPSCAALLGEGIVAGFGFSLPFQAPCPAANPGPSQNRCDGVAWAGQSSCQAVGTAGKEKAAKMTLKKIKQIQRLLEHQKKKILKSTAIVPRYSAPFAIFICFMSFKQTAIYLLGFLGVKQAVRDTESALPSNSFLELCSPSLEGRRDRESGVTKGCFIFAPSLKPGQAPW